jgi:3-deoxy-D-manno-octulosonic-acid transferase
MTIFHLLYIFLGSSLTLILLPGVWLRWKKDRELKTEIKQRLGFEEDLQQRKPFGRPLIWLHAVSVGEVKAAETVIHSLDRIRPRCAILLTTTTRTGQEYARRQLGERTHVRFAPLDLWTVAGRFLSAYRPDLLVCMETELWPNWFTRAHRFGMRIAILNGRISSRSIRSYLQIRPLIKPVLKTIDAFSMKSETDASRIRRLGAPQKRVFVNGNVKMDAQDSGQEEVKVEALRKIYSVSDQMPVIVAGSIRGEELALLMDVFLRLVKELPEVVCILAPRHIENAKRIADLANAQGVSWQYRTSLDEKKNRRRESLVILNTIGELRQVYALARVVFCGGSLVPLGGQNILEAAIQAKPVLYGPFMEDFSEERDLVESWGGGICVSDNEELAHWALHLLLHPEKARRIGNLAKQAILCNQGAAMRHAKVIERLLSDL